MATIKSYTCLEQSKKLTEILPLESADMKILPFTEREYRIVPINDISVYDREDEIYAWSLAALLSVLPSATLDSSNDHHYRLHCMERYTEWYDNAIDACCEMILKLHELKML